MTGLAAGLARRFAERTIRSELKGGVRRAVAVGGADRDPAPGRPLVVYANHHVYADSFLLWWLVERVWRRPFVIWMEAWDRAPLFGPVGALPFPAGDARRRMRTIRETARRLAGDRATLCLYPEGTMGIPEDGLGLFRADMARMARLLPDETAWAPLGISLSWWGESRPSAALALGEVHDRPDGDERQRLSAALRSAAAVRPGDPAPVVFEGGAGPDERWDLSPLAPLFEKLTFPR
ncbi:MAG: 1-acyl-sn-glycerol-3-phosphate acyltransferase [Bacteroidota bacterium]